MHFGWRRHAALSRLFGRSSRGRECCGRCRGSRVCRRKSWRLQSRSNSRRPTFWSEGLQMPSNHSGLGTVLGEWKTQTTQRTSHPFGWCRRSRTLHFGTMWTSLVLTNVALVWKPPSQRSSWVKVLTSVRSKRRGAIIRRSSRWTRRAKPTWQLTRRQSRNGLRQIVDVNVRRDRRVNTPWSSAGPSLEPSMKLRRTSHGSRRTSKRSLSEALRTWNRSAPGRSVRMRRLWEECGILTVPFQGFWGPGGIWWFRAFTSEQSCWAVAKSDWAGIQHPGGSGGLTYGWKDCFSCQEFGPWIVVRIDRQSGQKSESKHPASGWGDWGLGSLRRGPWLRDHRWLVGQWSAARLHSANTL